jgi:hypothetical protein
MMPSEPLISLATAPQNQVKYQLKSLFWPTYYYYLAVTILAVLVGEMFSPTLTSMKSIYRYVFIPWLLYISIAPLLATWFLRKLFVVGISSEGLNGHGFFGKSRYISWHDISLVKIFTFLGIRSLQINKNIYLASYFYGNSKILNLVREYAGEEHPVVRALEKESLHPYRNPAKRPWQIISSIALIVSIWLIGGNLVAAHLEQPLEKAIASYLKNHTRTEANQSAIDLNALIAKLGIPANSNDDLSKEKIHPAKSIILERKAIKVISDKYLDQLYSTEDSINPLPIQLEKYLKTHQSDIEEIKNFLVKEPLLNWGNTNDFQKIDRRYPNSINSPNTKWISSWGISELQKLLIINTIDKQLSSNNDISNDLQAIAKIQSSFQQQEEFTGQFSSNSGSLRLAKLVQHFDQVLMEWGSSLIDQNHSQKMLTALINSSMYIPEESYDPTGHDSLQRYSTKPLAQLAKYHRLFQPYLRLVAADDYNKQDEILSYWKGQNICHSDGNHKVAIRPSILNVAYDDSLPEIGGHIYLRALILNLNWELAKSVRQVKSLLKIGQSTNQIAREFKLQSQTCPGEQWLAKARNNEITISLSRSPNWEKLGLKSAPLFKADNITQLTYKVNPIKP